MHVKTQRLWDLEWRSRRVLVVKDRGHSTHRKAGALGSARGSLLSLGVGGTTMLVFEEPIEEVFAYGVGQGCEVEDEDRNGPAKSTCSLDAELSSLKSPKSWAE